MADYEEWEARDPLKVLMRRGQDCTHCLHKVIEPVFDRSVEICTKRHKPGKRCEDFQHKGVA